MRNPKYLDKNYAGTLIIWDRMFGTFQVEEEEPVYGLTKPLNSWNPLWANVHVWSELCRDAWLAPRWIDKLRIWFMPQGWRPRGLPANPAAPDVNRATVILYDTRVPRTLNVYALMQFVAALILAVGLLVTGGTLPRTQLIVAALLVLWTLLNIGGIFDRRRVGTRLGARATTGGGRSCDYDRCLTAQRSSPWPAADSPGNAGFSC